MVSWLSIGFSVLLWWRVRGLRRRMAELEFALGALRANPQGAAAAVQTSPPPRRAEPPPLPVQVAAREFPGSATDIASPEKPTPAEGLAHRLVKAAGGWEELIGGNLLNKLGALVSVLGIALFLNFSFARMGPEGRVATGLVVGLSMLGAGIRWERAERYRIFAGGLIAAGWASLYFTSYAAHAVEPARIIENPAVGVTLMLAVASGMVAHSLRYRSQALTSLAFGCIFAAFALSGPDLPAVFGVVPAALAMLWLARRAGWREMPWFAAAATYATFLTRPSAGTSLFYVEGMLLLYWTIFEVFDCLPGRSRGPHLFALNALAGLGTSAAVWFRAEPESMAAYCWLAASVYGISAAVRLVRGWILTGAGALALSSVLCGLALFADVEGIWLPLATALEAELLVAIYWVLRLPVVRALALAAFGAAVRHAFVLRATVLAAGFPLHAWVAPLAVIVLLLYGNRRLLRGEAAFSYAASVLTAVLILTESPWEWTGALLLFFGVILLETGARTGVREFRAQAYAVLAVGTGASIASRECGTYALATALWLATAVRAAKGFPELADWERRLLRAAGSISLAVLAPLLAVELTQARYDAIAMVAASVALLEFAKRGWPAELRRPAIVLNGISLAILVSFHAGSCTKFPARPVWLSMAIGALLYAFVTVRMLDDRGLFRKLAPVASIALGLLSIWMVLPDAWVPLAYLGLARMLILAGQADLEILGRAVSFAGALAVYSENGMVLAANSLLSGALQVWLWRRHAATAFAYVHSWLAAMAVLLIFPIVWPDQWLLPFTLSGIAIGYASHRSGLADLRWPSVFALLIATAAALWGACPVWHRAAVAVLLAAPLLYERPDGNGVFIRTAFGSASALTGAVTLFREISGGVLTLTWGLEAVALLCTGFVMRERPLRLAGLGLLLVCIGKAFLYDLRNLETVYRILSFTGLGAMLLAVSWLYTRFREQLRRML